MAAELPDNNRIAKNTLMLYLRMILVLGIAIYTSRVVLNTLGVEDYGVYSVVGGFVSMLAYFNSVCVGASQRFLSFAIGKGDAEAINITFATCKRIHLLLAIIIILISETFGLWFVNYKMVIAADRIVAANWVYQCSLASLFITVISIPYTAAIVAHEHMHVYAFVSILDVLLKLVILFLLVIIPADKLIVYALLHIGITLVLRIIYTVYCRRHFEECRVKAFLDKQISRKMFSFAGWTAMGSLGFSFKDQFSNMILNNFYGTSINAARGIAMQVNSAVSSFSDNFFTAIKPQIVKQYAAGNIEQSQKLVYAGARYSFFLMSLFSIPVIINIDNILHLWLGVVPEYTSQFLIITLLSSLIYSLTTSTSTAIQATGNIKVFQIGVTFIMLLELPAAFFILRAGCEPPMALIPGIVTTILALIFRFIVLKKQIQSYSLRKYFIGTVLLCLLLFCISFVICFIINRYIPNGLIGMFLSLMMCLFVTGTIILLFGINKYERKLLMHFVANKLSLR